MYYEGRYCIELSFRLSTVFLFSGGGGWCPYSMMHYDRQEWSFQEGQTKKLPTLLTWEALWANQGTNGSWNSDLGGTSSSGQWCLSPGMISHRTRTLHRKGPGTCGLEVGAPPPPCGRTRAINIQASKRQKNEINTAILKQGKTHAIGSFFS